MNYIIQTETIKLIANELVTVTSNPIGLPLINNP
jgi:hypothetical protein